MRRPVKPFVTEYRGGNRRQAAAAQTPKQDFLSMESESAAPEPRPMLADSAQEDSYEAAMRAADALFSTREPALPHGAAATGTQTDPSHPPSHPSGGRILRVLDEAPSPEMARLEAERAPKRRGRKPGSKNKPKLVPPLVADEAVAPPPAQPSAAPASVLPLPLSVAALTQGIARTASPGDKYAWVRTKLKPGQQWKRRLPKVAW